MERSALALCVSTLLADPMAADAEQVVAALDAAAAAGVGHVSLWSLHAATLDGGDGPSPEELLAARGLTCAMVEAVAGFGAGPGPGLDAELDFTLGWVERLGARLVGAVAMEAFADADLARDGLAHTADRAAAVGARVAVEFVPWSPLSSLARTWEFLAEIDRPGLGITLDPWHWHHQPGGPDLDAVTLVPPERLSVLQLCDAAPVAEVDPFEECMHRRRLPGEGAVDLDGLLATLAAHGATPLIAPEVFDDDLVARGPGPAAEAIVAASLARLAAVEWDAGPPGAGGSDRSG